MSEEDAILLDITKSIDLNFSFATNDDGRKLLLEWLIFYNFLTEDLSIVVIRRGLKRKKRNFVLLDSGKEIESVVAIPSLK